MVPGFVKVIHDASSSYLMDGQKLLQIMVRRTQILYFLTLLLITKFEIFHFKVRLTMIWM
ncbi:hypothetical protein HanXRQr2_Chr06g0259511 [Helianthus annuus]|nr:hypothetical protein HanXRQr2_Chr06g0259511 [Helianthus annuus]KAJ0915499.1 hypothetical protein HanPSC8_Chr06g0250511 [Helianthus annuus]